MGRNLNSENDLSENKTIKIFPDLIILPKHEPEVIEASKRQTEPRKKRYIAFAIGKRGAIDAQPIEFTDGEPRTGVCLLDLKGAVPKDLVYTIVNEKGDETSSKLRVELWRGHGEPTNKFRLTVELYDQKDF